VTGPPARSRAASRPTSDVSEAAAAAESTIAPWMEDRGSIVCADHVSHYFGKGDARNQVLFDNCLEIGPGQLVVMTGPSGSGKTTLLTLIGALRKVQQGELTVLGRTMSGLDAASLVAMRRDVGIIFQLHNLFESLSAFENVKMAMQLGECPPAQMRARGSDILSRLGLGHRLDYKPKALSGGQCQRVAIARALVNRPRLVLADEPTASLDKDSTANVVKLFQELVSESRCTILMVTHDNRVLDAADRIVNMVDGRIVSDVFVREAALLCQFLASVTGFERMSPAELTSVAGQMKPRRMRAGDELVRQGDIGLELFVIRSGKVEVLQTQGGDTRKLAELDSGDFFGERALITGEPRVATVRALEGGVVYTLDKGSFQQAIESSPSFKEQVLSVYFQRQ
jgi:putative ABC transport system ATP-binding protein